MIDTDLARRLHTAGLIWEPAEGDRFILPDRDMDEHVFTISEMVVEVRTAPTGRIIAFNGTTEWALDAVEQTEVVWLPREDQLRHSLGDTLLSLVREETAWRCTIILDGRLHDTAAADAATAYALALLEVLYSRGVSS